MLVICALVIIFLSIFVNILILKKDIKESVVNQQRIIDKQEKMHLTAIQEIEKAQNQSAAQAKEIQSIWNEIKKLKSDANELLSNHQRVIDKQAKMLLTATQEIEKVQIQSATQTKEIQSLKVALEETRRELDFYKNIEEDSGNLNLNSDNQERTEALETIEQQISAATDCSKDSAPNKDNQEVRLDDEQSFAREEMEKSHRNFFITGKAGTGKSFLLNAFRKTTSKKYIVLAPTGIAALNVEGATLHSTFGYDNLVKLDIDSISENTIVLKSEKKKILQSVNTIIIDEISMVSADTFEKIDRILKIINNNNKPFGGKQILLFGDLFQLPPVTKVAETKYMNDKYGGIYFFCSNAYKNGHFTFYELETNHRQKEDSAYFELLNHIRDGNTTDADIATLNSRVDHDLSIYDRFTLLLPNKADVEAENRKHLDKLDSKEYVYPAKIILDKYPDKTHDLDKTFPITNQLRLKKGALVMMVVNDPNHRWVNGTLGIIRKLTESSILVAINKQVYEVFPCDFSQQEVTYKDKDGTIQYEDILKISQYPLVLAYAITIHKSQGQTYQNIVCDIDRCFTNGQAYVALSRCTSLNGLHLKQSVSKSSIMVDHIVLDFYNAQTLPF